MSDVEPFIDAITGHKLFGVDLFPYTPMRKMAAQRMGLIFPNTEMNPWPYPGANMDVAIMLWLCSIDQGTWTPLRALREPEKALETAVDWAGVHRLTENSKEFGEALNVFVLIMREVYKTEFTLSSNEASPDQEEGDLKV